MKRNRPNLSSSSLAGVALFLMLAFAAGCSKKEEPQTAAAPEQAPAARPVPKPAQPVQTQLSTAQAAGGSLDFKGRNDPFKPIPSALPPAPAAQAPAGGTPSRPPSEDLLPIQSFEVTKFKVAGIIAGLRENRALLIDPNGKGYVVQQGMAIGNADGRITRITANAVEVTERYREDKGRVRTRKIVLTLTKKK